MSKENKRRVAGYMLLVAMIFLAIGIAADMVFFTWGAILLVLISLILGERWKRFKR